MNAPVQPPVEYPATLHEWERILTNALLRADAGNADVIRSFEITPETLAGFCGLGPEHAGEVEGAFRKALLADRYLLWRLKNGPYPRPNDNAPNCIATLAFSLLVDSLLDGDYGDVGAYRAKMRQWLGVDRSFMDLRGIATMWQSLVDWLDERADAGEPYRRLVLPEIPVTWTHIGYTRYLSFPTKRDLRLLAKQLERNAAADPAALVRLLDPIVRSSSVSFGLQQAFDDFRIALRSGGASVDHRFWRLVARARLMAGHQEAPLAELWMEFDEDGGRGYRFKTADSASAYYSPGLGAAVAATALQDSPNLAPSIRRGILFFRSSGLASWTAVGEPPSGVGPFHVAVAERHVRLAGGAIAQFEPSGAWRATIEPVPSGTVVDILRRLGINNVKENVRTVGLVDGVRVGKAWLGRPRYMPHLEGATGDVEIKSISGEGGTIAWLDGTLTASGPVNGEFVFSDRAAGWSRRASFVAVADVHQDLQGSGYALDVQEEWRAAKLKPMGLVAEIEPNWSEREYDHQDMLEALYAAARSGLSEGDAMAIVGRASGRRCWDMLRTLQEATFIDARLRTRWRGRMLTLGRARLIETRIGKWPGVVASGATPARLEADFRQTVELQGGRAFRHLDPTSLAPPLIGAVDVDPAALSQALGWPLERATEPDGARGELPQTKVVGDGYLLASAWDWSIGRFRAGGRADGPATLVRLTHPGQRDHDLYRVAGHEQRTFLSRHAAIIDLHAQAGMPLFRLVDGAIRRKAAEGAVPIEIARALRLRTLQNGGAAVDGWVYGLERRDERWLAELLPGLIEGLKPARAADPTLAHLRGRGARRPLWIDGGLAA